MVKRGQKRVRKGLSTWSTTLILIIATAALLFLVLMYTGIFSTMTHGIS